MRAESKLCDASPRLGVESGRAKVVGKKAPHPAAERKTSIQPLPNLPFEPCRAELYSLSSIRDLIFNRREMIKNAFYAQSRFEAPVSAATMGDSELLCFLNWSSSALKKMESAKKSVQERH